MLTLTRTIIVTKDAEGVWAFDDLDRGLVREPFILGADTLLDVFASMLNTCSLSVEFADAAFPGWNASLTGDNRDTEGRWYHVHLPHVPEVAPFRAWLCPATLKYFRDYPDHLYLRVNPA